MRHRHFVSILSVLGLVTTAGANAVPGAPPGQGTLQVGADSRTVLPLVDGSHDYLQAGFPERGNAFDPGIPVSKWDDGRIAVGNGESESYWVHDDIRVTALAIDDPRSPHIVVIVATDLYMVFRNDGEEIRARAAKLLPPGVAKKLKVVVTASHNHHGPDTAFDVNHDWYDYMTGQAAATVAAAVKSRRPARLQVASGEHWFGMNDGTDPNIYDPRLNVLQAIDTRGQVIATTVQWNLHPEATLGWAPPLEEIEDDCPMLGLAGSNCNAEGRYFTSDFVGVLREDLGARYGGEVVFLNGALGVLIGPGGSDVWEVTSAHPLGNQLKAPPGAVAPGGGINYTQRNFRRGEVIGEQLALAAGRLLDSATKITAPRVSYSVQPFYTYLSNMAFRYLLTVNPATGRTSLGHNPAPLYICPLGGAKTDANCTSDGFAATTDPLLGLTHRVGDHLKSAVEYVRIGPVGMMFLPGEVPGELTIGLPALFRSEPENWYEEPAGTHAFGDDYQVPGYAQRRMSDRYEWMVGLGSDQIGYFVPLSNYRVACVADLLAGPGACDGLHAAGAIEFPDAVAGATCKRITDDPSELAGYPEPARTAIWASCRYGQLLDEAQGHYEETNSAGWDIVQDMMDAIGVLTGNSDPTEVNPAFKGWWQKNLPPHDLP
jgi:hypothetical protein